MKKLLCLLFVGVFLFASDYGRISGRVTDEETGEALIGADVYLQGTELGAATDGNGEYSILYVPVGTYQVVAAYVGYNEFTYTPDYNTIFSSGTKKVAPWDGIPITLNS